MEKTQTATSINVNPDLDRVLSDYESLAFNSASDYIRYIFASIRASGYLPEFGIQDRLNGGKTYTLSCDNETRHYFEDVAQRQGLSLHRTLLILLADFLTAPEKYFIPGPGVTIPTGRLGVPTDSQRRTPLQVARDRIRELEERVAGLLVANPHGAIMLCQEKEKVGKLQAELSLLQREIAAGTDLLESESHAIEDALSKVLRREGEIQLLTANFDKLVCKIGVDAVEIRRLNSVVDQQDAVYLEVVRELAELKALRYLTPSPVLINNLEQDVTLNLRLRLSVELPGLGVAQVVEARVIG